MSRIVAIDWDRHEARAVLLDTGPLGARLVQAVSVRCDSPESAGKELTSTLADQSLFKAQTVVALGRQHVQLKLLDLPPAPNDELPEMVRFQAERDALGGNDAVLDYLHLAGSEQLPHRVLVAALSKSGMERANSVCQAVGVEPKQMALRACAAASLSRRATGFDPQSVALLVCPLADEAELIVIADGEAVLMRTVRLPTEEEIEPPVESGEPPVESAEWSSPPTDASLQGMMAVGLDQRQAALACEMRRTMLAARQQLGDREIDAAYICDAESMLGGRIAVMSRQLRVPCAVLNPFTAVGSKLSGVDEENLPEHPGRFAGVLGLALDAAEHNPPTIDFLHPRRREEESNVKRVHVLAGVAAASLLALVGIYGYYQLNSPLREAAQLRTRARELQQVVDQYADVEAQAAQIETWLATDVNWLDEIERIGRQLRPEPLRSEQFDADQDVVLTQFYANISSGRRSQEAKLTLTVVGKSETVFAPLERRLADEAHIVTQRALGGQDESVSGYSDRLEMDMLILPDKIDYAQESEESEETPSREPESRRRRSRGARSEGTESEAAQSEDSQPEDAATEESEPENSEPQDTSPGDTPSEEAAP